MTVNDSVEWQTRPRHTSDMICCGKRLPSSHSPHASNTLLIPNPYLSLSLSLSVCFTIQGTGYSTKRRGG